MNAKKFTTKDMAYSAIGVALITVCSWLSVPMTIPFTMQTFAVCLVTALLGLRGGILSVLVYILLGAVGMPVFAGFAGGPASLFGVTGGYIIGFIFTAVAVGLLTERFGRTIPVLICSMSLGILLCYVFGTAWFMFVYGKNTGPIGLGTALSWCVVPYIVPDAVKVILASVLAVRLYPLIGMKK